MNRKTKEIVFLKLKAISVIKNLFTIMSLIINNHINNFKKNKTLIKSLINMKNKDFKNHH